MTGQQPSAAIAADTLKRITEIKLRLSVEQGDNPQVCAEYYMVQLKLAQAWAQHALATLQKQKADEPRPEASAPELQPDDRYERRLDY